MFPQVDTRVPTDVELEVRSHYAEMFPRGDRGFVPRIFGWAIDCFDGRYRDYQPIDARYHDLEHTLQGTLCMARLLGRWHDNGGSPSLTQQMVELGLLAILLHDTGYLKTRGDTEGTGAKYTLTHVSRSAEFASGLLGEQGYSDGQIRAVQHMIRCTGVNVDLNSIPFNSELERKVGFALGSADLIGQMAADDYIEKLPILYAEFAESARYNNGAPSAAAGFTSADDLMRKTPLFWEKYVIPKLNSDFQGVYRFLEIPYPGGPNYYVQRIEANIDRLRRLLADAAATSAAA